MRLSADIQEHIRQVFLQTFHKGELYLFGSRVNDHAHGGDIDLYILPDDPNCMLEKKLAFLVQLKRRIGERKIDLVIGQAESRSIDQVALAQGVLLCRQH